MTIKKLLLLNWTCKKLIQIYGLLSQANLYQQMILVLKMIYLLADVIPACALFKFRMAL